MDYMSLETFIITFISLKLNIKSKISKLIINLLFQKLKITFHNIYIFFISYKFFKKNIFKKLYKKNINKYYEKF